MLWKNESAWNQYSRNAPPRGNSTIAGALAIEAVVVGEAAAATPGGSARPPRAPSDAAPTAAPFKRPRRLMPFVSLTMGAGDTCSVSSDNGDGCDDCWVTREFLSEIPL